MTNRIVVRELPSINLYSIDDGKPQFKYKFAKGKYKGQDKIIDYMKSAIAYGARPEILYDAFSNKAIPNESLVMTDGHFRWSSELLYYVENYNLILPKEFVDIIKRDVKVKVKVEDLV